MVFWLDGLCRAFIERVLHSQTQILGGFRVVINWCLSPALPCWGCHIISSAAELCCSLLRCEFFPKCCVFPLVPRDSFSPCFRILFDSPTDAVLTTASLYTSLPSSRFSVHKSTCSLLLCLFPALLSDSQQLSLVLFDSQNHSNWPAFFWSAST